MTQTTWATAGDVASLTGQSIDTTELEQANGVIELHAGKIYTLAVANTGTRDIEWMRRACAYQAAWMRSQPDMFARLDLNAVTQEGRAVGLKEHALVLAPLAKKALNRVSWLRSRSLHVRAPFEDGLGAAVLGGAVVDYDDMDGGGW
jgi:hypothetical protein